MAGAEGARAELAEERSHRARAAAKARVEAAWMEQHERQRLERREEALRARQQWTADAAAEHARFLDASEDARFARQQQVCGSPHGGSLRALDISTPICARPRRSWTDACCERAATDALASSASPCDDPPAAAALRLPPSHTLGSHHSLAAAPPACQLACTVHRTDERRGT